MPRLALLGLLAPIALGGALACGGGEEIERRSSLQRGRDLFASRETGGTQNQVSCATCHFTEPDPASSRILAGHPLAGAVQRPTFWGGQRTDLLQAINDCRYFFMGSTAPWTRDDEQAKVVHEYLGSLPPSLPNALPFTIVPVAKDVPGGDAKRGEAVYDGACRACHGAVHTGRDKIRGNLPVLPDEEVKALRELFNFDATQIRITFIEKIRHGGFLGLYGLMPPYSTEALSDADLGALLTFFQL
jgi:thiosulfate dehydrogenase